jgi:hypothetical protein
MNAAERYAQLWRELEAADELDFDYGFCVEHHFNPNESGMPSRISQGDKDRRAK